MADGDAGRPVAGLVDGIRSAGGHCADSVFLYRARRVLPQAGPVLLNLVVSELLKILWIVILLMLAPRLVPSLSWPAMLVGMLAAIATYGALPLYALARRPGNVGKEGG